MKEIGKSLNKELTKKKGTKIEFVDEATTERKTNRKRQEIKNGLYIAIVAILISICIGCLAIIVIQMKKRYHPKYTVPDSVPTEDEYIITTDTAKLPDLQPYLNEPIGALYCEKWNLGVTLKYSAEQLICNENHVATAIPIEYGTPAIGQEGYSIIGDHNNQDFGKLALAEIGDKLYIKTFYGEFVYEVSDIEYGHVSDHSESIYLDDEEEYIQEICNTKDMRGIVLYTCYPFDAIDTSRRVLVFCNQIDGTTIM